MISYYQDSDGQYRVRILDRSFFSRWAFFHYMKGHQYKSNECEFLIPQFCEQQKTEDSTI